MFGPPDRPMDTLRQSLDFTHTFRYVIIKTGDQGTMRIFSRPALRTRRSLMSGLTRPFRLLVAAALIVVLGGLNDSALVAGTSWASVPPLRIVIYKGRQMLAVYEGARLIKNYRVSLGLEPLGAKTETGDRKTPEGEYFICNKSSSSSFHRFLGISYPSELDAMRAFENGLISLETRNAIVRSAQDGKSPLWNTKLGGWVGIHGYPTEANQKRWVSLLYPKPHNWTNGCIALWDSEIEELYEMLPLGTPVTILP